MKVKVYVRTPDLGEFSSKIDEISESMYELVLNQVQEQKAQCLRLPTNRGVVIIPKDVLDKSIIEFIKFDDE